MIKIQISINIEIFLFVLIFIITKQIDIYVLFILFTLIHEISHSLMGALLGLKLRRFEVMPFGFKITFEECKTYKKMPVKRFLITIVGPLTNLGIMMAAIVLKLNTNIVYTNLIIGIFNLIPIYPLDGGRILKTILNIKLVPREANYIINKISYITIIVLTVITSILILYIKNIAILFVLAYLWYIVIRENKRYNLLSRVYDIIKEQDVDGAAFCNPQNGSVKK